MNNMSMHQPDMSDIEDDEVVQPERQLADRRENTIRYLKTIDITVPHNEFTCDGCHQRHFCKYSYDAYNTAGDCLACK